MKLPIPPHVRWPLFIIGALAIQVVASLVTIYIASTEPSFAVEEDYYQKALHWEDRQAQRHRNAELGWQLDVQLEPATVVGDLPKLSVVLTDAGGAPVNDAVIDVAAFHNARADFILRARLTETGDGSYSTELQMRRSGVWELRFTVERGGEIFTYIERRHFILE